MLFLKVPRNKAEKIRQQLVKEGLFSRDYRVFMEGDFVFIPVKKAWRDFELVERDLEPVPKHFTKLKDALSGFLSPAEMESVITSFDIIGDIAIVEIPTELEAKEKQIAEALLKVHRNLKTVLKKLSPMEGEFRVRKLRRIAGEDRTETLYRESGVKMRLDLSKVYFSVRLSHERKRIAELVKDGERILVLFAGVGPFALVIAKSKPNTKVVAVELNPDAVAYMKKNIGLNKIKNIEVIEGDARNFAGTGFDRVLMPLPKDAEHFLDVAFRSVKNRGVVHFYTFASMAAPFGDAMKKASLAADASGVSAEAVSERIVRPFSPNTVQVVLDLIVKKNQ